MFGQGVGEDDHEENEESNRQIGDQMVGCVPDLAFALLDQPTGAEKGITETQADAAKRREGTEPAKVAAAVLAVGDWKAFHERADGHALFKRGDERSAGEAGVPKPTQPLRLVAKLERHAAQDQARQHKKEQQVECREEGPL